MKSLIRFYLRWKIQTCLDEGQTPGRFLLWWIEHDSPTRHYYQQIKQLDLFLREEADIFEWRTIPSTLPLVPARRFPSPRTSRTHLLYWCSVAALFLFIVFSGAPLLLRNSGENVTAVIPVSHISASRVSAPHSEDWPLAELINPSMEPLRATYEVGKEMIGKPLGDLGISVFIQVAGNFSSSGGLTEPSRSEEETL